MNMCICMRAYVYVYVCMCVLHAWVLASPGFEPKKAPVEPFPGQQEQALETETSGSLFLSLVALQAPCSKRPQEGRRTIQDAICWFL